jgi:hypothetical protein
VPVRPSDLFRVDRPVKREHDAALDDRTGASGNKKPPLAPAKALTGG